jgi:uncharacterized membrane protein YdjX (TVP38/TMEM64 family)
MNAVVDRGRAALREIQALGPLAPLAVFTVVGPALGALVLAATASRWFPFLEGLGPAALPILVLATVVLAGASLVPTHATSLVAGLLFGAAWGSIIALGSVAAAALVAFGLVRKVVGVRLVEALARRPRAAAVHQELLLRSGRRAAALIALVRLSPVMPFAATNLVMSAAGVTWRVFLLGSIAGMTPRVVAVAWAGAGLAELDLGAAADRRVALVGLLATVAALVVAGRLGRRALATATRPHAEPELGSR